MLLKKRNRTELLDQLEQNYVLFQELRKFAGENQLFQLLGMPLSMQIFDIDPYSDYLIFKTLPLNEDTDLNLLETIEGFNPQQQLQDLRNESQDQVRKIYQQTNLNSTKKLRSVDPKLMQADQPESKLLAMDFVMSCCVNYDARLCFVHTYMGKDISRFTSQTLPMDRRLAYERLQCNRLMKDLLRHLLSQLDTKNKTYHAKFISTINSWF